MAMPTVWWLNKFSARLLRVLYTLISCLLLTRICFSLFDNGFLKFFSSFWRLIEFGSCFSAILSQIYYSSQKAYTDVAWIKYNREDYIDYVKEDAYCKFRKNLLSVLSFKIAISRP